MPNQNLTSLVTLNDRCQLILSIDPRPQEQWDERGTSFKYVENSTARMLSTLQTALPNVVMSKVITYDMDAAQLPLSEIEYNADYVLIDGEHTNVAAFSDFLSLFPKLAPNAIVAFHDANLISDALANIERFLKHKGLVYKVVVLPDCVCAMALGGFATSIETSLADLIVDRSEFEIQARRGVRNSLAQQAFNEGSIPSKALRRAALKRLKNYFLR